GSIKVPIIVDIHEPDDVLKLARELVATIAECLIAVVEVDLAEGVVAGNGEIDAPIAVHVAGSNPVGEGVGNKVGARGNKLEVANILEDSPAARRGGDQIGNTIADKGWRPIVVSLGIIVEDGADGLSIGDDGTIGGTRQIDKEGFIGLEGGVAVDG